MSYLSKFSATLEAWLREDFDGTVTRYDVARLMYELVKELAGRAQIGGAAMTEMVFLKIKFAGSYWKIGLVINLAKVLRLKTIYYAGGSGYGEL